MTEMKEKDNDQISCITQASRYITHPGYYNDGVVYRGSVMRANKYLPSIKAVYHVKQ